MKSLQNFLFELSELDVRLWVDGDRLRCNAPQAALTPAVCAELAERKAEILKFLNQANLAACSTLELIQPVPRDGNIPLSFGQQGLWFLDQLERESIAYNQLFAIHLNGSLNVTVLEQALTEIVRRHEVLRTTFPNVDGQPVQVIAPNPDLSLSVVDLSDLPEAKQSAEVQQLAISELDRPFNLSQLPLLRVTLLQLKEAEHVLLFTIHHIIGDGWSGGIIIRELGALYKALLTGEPCPLPELSIQYADFAYWQQQWLREVAFAEQLTYWKQQLAGASHVLQLPSDRPRPAIQTHRGATITLNLGVEVTQKLKQLSQQEGATLFMTLLAAFQVLLYRYTNQDDICVGTTLANRHSPDLESLVGFFVNTAVMRTDLSGNPSFRELLGRVRRVALEAQERSDLPFNLLVEKLQPERNLSHTPLFQVMFVLENAPIDTLELPGLTISRFELAIAAATFDLSLSMRETRQGLIGNFEYNIDLFDAATITRMAGHFETLLTAIVANPQQRLYELPLLTETERHQLLVEWNKTQVNYSQNQCIHHLFEAQVERTPDAVAGVFKNERLTYRQLNQRANQLAHYLKKLGVKPEVLVGICVERSLEMVVGLLGILKAGGAYLPLDPTYPKERLTFMLSDAGVSVLLTQEKFVEHLPEHQASVVYLDRDWKVISQEYRTNPDSGVQPENLAYVIYTSGSTGKPKGVMIQHQSLVNFTEAASVEYGLSACDRVLQFASISFDAAAEEIYPCLTCGGTLVLRTDEMLRSIPTFVQKCWDLGLTVLDLPTAYWHQLTSELANTDLVLPDSLRLVIIGGEPALLERVKTWQNYVGNRPQLVNTYGPTEATVVATIYKFSEPATTDRLWREAPIGHSIRNVQVYVLDRYLQPVPIGVPGELYIGGAGLARGYLNSPELTADKFIPNPFKRQNFDSERLYKTGDLVRYLPDGTIEYVGRIDEQVKIRGFRIEVGEIEAILSQQPEVQSAVVVAREDEPGNKYLVAYIGSNQPAPSLKCLRDVLRQQLPEYMVPSAFVLLDTLPLTPNGKVNRHALPQPEHHLPMAEVSGVLPQTEAERIIATVWQEILQLERVGIHDNFFNLGGHSLLLGKMQFQLQERFGQEISVIDLFKYPTIHTLANYLSLNSSEQSDSQPGRNRAETRSTRQASMKQKRQVRQQHRVKNKTEGGSQ
jgi:amino acid adenylation domain-containing protein